MNTQRKLERNTIVHRFAEKMMRGRIKLQYDTELGVDASVIIPQYGFEIKF